MFLSGIPWDGAEHRGWPTSRGGIAYYYPSKMAAPFQETVSSEKMGRDTRKEIDHNQKQRIIKNT